MRDLICWFEIPVKDFDRSVEFYQKVLLLRFELKNFGGVRHAVFKIPNLGTDFITGSLVEMPDYHNLMGSGAILFFNANIGMTDVLEKVEHYGGKILVNKTIVKDKQDDVTSVIPKNLIGKDIGYFAYCTDCEGNKIGLYANS